MRSPGGRARENKEVESEIGDQRGTQLSENRSEYDFITLLYYTT